MLSSVHDFLSIAWRIASVLCSTHSSSKGKPTMKSRFFYLAVLVAFVLFSGRARARPLDAPPAAPTQNGGFTNASFQGNYALTGFLGANVAAVVGVCHFDGNGHFNCTYTGNGPGEKGKRNIAPMTDKGEYTVNADGTGTIHEFETVGGTTSEYYHDIVILHAEALGSYTVATEVFGLVRETDPSGALLTSHYDRLPDVGAAPSTEEVNKAAVYAWADALNTGNLDVIDRAVDQYIAKDHVVHNPNLPAGTGGPEDLKRLQHEFMPTVPDFHSTVEDVIAEGDMVAYRLTLTGHDPNDPAATLTVLNITRFVDGQMAEEWELP
jgi:predicted SnoaL-like aldol condensation-catalyzing enzyme